MRSTFSERHEGLYIAALLAIPLIIAFCVSYVAAEHPAYVWDYGAYWGYFKNYASLISSGDPNWFAQFRQEVSSLDYNPLAAVLLYPFYLISGDGRTSYVVGICLLYLLPAIVVTSRLGLLAAPSANAILIFVMAFTYIPFWTPSLRGMVDIVGLIPLGLATLLILKTEFLSKRPIRYSILLGILIYLPFVLRRWYAYSIVIFLVLGLVFGVVSRLRSGRPWPRAIISTALALALTGVVAATLLLTVQLDLVKRVLVTSYADLHAAYQARFAQHLTLFPGRLGWYFIPMIVSGALIGFVTRNVVAMFCFLGGVGTFLFFIQTQQLAEHHFLPVAFWLFPAYIVAATWLAQWLTFLPAPARLLPFLVAGAGVFVLSIVPGLNKGGRYIAPFVPRYATFPLHLDNYSEYQRLLADLDARLGKNEKVVVYSWGMALSDSLLSALNPAITPHISYVSYFPAAELFRFDNLRADYALVRSDDLRLHAPEALKNVTVPGEMILTGTGLGAAYEKVGSYKLSEGQTAELFRRTRPVTSTEVKEFIDELSRGYGKDYLQRYRRKIDIPLALRTDIFGDVYGTIHPVGPGALLIHPGLDTATSTTIPIDPSISDPPSVLVLSISKQLLQTCPAADGVAASIKSGDEDVWSGQIMPGDVVLINLPAKGGDLNVVVDKRGEPNCDELVAAFEFAK
jgi:hypothetical protein